MALDGHVDVVVVGFGVAGAAAALAAAHAGSRVLVLDQTPLSEYRLTGSRRPRELLRAGLRAAAREAGAEVRPRTRAHELLVAGGEVCGLGYATPVSRAVGARHRWLRAAANLAPRRLRPRLENAAETLWRDGFLVGEVDCSSVVLAMDAGHWDFVGPATWSAARAGLAAVEARPKRSRWPELPSGDPTPELAVRAWCAEREPAPEADAHTVAHTELGVDEETGAVLVGGSVPVPGLYAAVRTCHAGADDPGAHAVMTAGRRAGSSAVNAGDGRYGTRIRAVG
ncbi:FAD-binding protein [Actinocorallia sp. A-T 12471]|uniref:FAD-binding protein n=1 Tax=Actinocorallia sp. A-T 12471 TaxID=3089813 RepID=UPI0029CB6B0E|nr:FAD-binding protein [Actinocorallia sp. A-T 12471]MDX6742160.1 FAD-binding protein [Actinocorallia sp. A-T 12471]